MSLLDRFKVFDAFISAFLISIVGSAFLTNADLRWNVVVTSLVAAVVQGLNGLRKQLSNPNKPQLEDFQIQEKNDA